MIICVENLNVFALQKHFLLIIHCQLVRFIARQSFRVSLPKRKRGQSFLIKSNQWSIINAAFWLDEPLIGYVL